MSLSTVLLVFGLLCGSGSARIIKDLTHTFDKDAPEYPLSSFNLNITSYYDMRPLVAKDFGDYWLQFNYVEFYEHMGTHIDAPNHFGRGRWSTEQIPPERLVGPGVVIDVTEKAAANSDYAVTVDDILKYEQTFGKIPPNAIVMMNSGWAKYYPNPKKVFGTETPLDKSTFHFPGFSIEACGMLLRERQVSVLGADTPSPDPAIVFKYECHVLLQNNNVPILEYVANLDSIPQNGTTIVLGSIKTRGGTGGPTRVIAIIDDDKPSISGATTTSAALVLPTVGFLVFFVSAMTLM